MTTTTLPTLADYPTVYTRCSGCVEDLPRSAKVELFANRESKWLVIECPKCGRFTPFRLEGLVQ